MQLAMISAKMMMPDMRSYFPCEQPARRTPTARTLNWCSRGGGANYLPPYRAMQLTCWSRTFTSCCSCCSDSSWAAVFGWTFLRV
jgi:hypothetical protein